MSVSTVFVQSTTAIASGAESITSGTFTRGSGSLGGVYALVVYNGDFVGNPATAAVYAGQNLAFIGGQVGGGGNVSVEIWGSSQLTSNSGTCTVGFAGGTLYDMILNVVDVDYVGTLTSPASESNTAAANTSPLSVTITAVDQLGGRKATVTVQATESIMLGVGGMAKGTSGSSLSTTAGTEIMPTQDAGTGLTRVSGISAWLQSTGGADVIEFTESVNRPWAMAMINVVGAACDGYMLKAGGAVGPVLI